MAGITTNVGENHYANILYGATAVDTNLYLGIYTLPTGVPDDTWVLADLTEVSGAGYARIALARGSWVITDDLAEYAEQSFDATSDWGDTYGYFLCSAASGVSGVFMYHIERFDDYPKNIPDGKSLLITPKITIA